MFIAPLREKATRLVSDEAPTKCADQYSMQDQAIHDGRMVMNTNTSQSLSLIFDHWQDEDRSMDATLREVRDWMKEVEQLGIPHFGEIAIRLRPLRERLVIHFEREDEMIAQLAASLLEPSVDFDQLRSESANDHEMLLAQLDDFSARLNETDPPFASWQAAMSEVESFIARLERHEAMESNAIEKFLP